MTEYDKCRLPNLGGVKKSENWGAGWQERGCLLILTASPGGCSDDTTDYETMGGKTLNWTSGAGPGESFLIPSGFTQRSPAVSWALAAKLSRLLALPNLPSGLAAWCCLGVPELRVEGRGIRIGKGHPAGKWCDEQISGRNRGPYRNTCRILLSIFSLFMTRRHINRAVKQRWDSATPGRTRQIVSAAMALGSLQEKLGSRNLSQDFATQQRTWPYGGISWHSLRRLLRP